MTRDLPAIPEGEFFDISQTLCEGVSVWPGDPEFRMRPVLETRLGESTNVHEIRFGTHTGTHIDAPFHIDDSAVDAAAVPLRHFAGRARVLSLPAEPCITAKDLNTLDWEGVERVLFRTYAGGLSGDSFDPNYIYLDEGASEFLAGKGILLVGTDAPSVDPFKSTDLRSHKNLICGGTAILEGIRLGNVQAGDYNLICLPLKLAGADGSPVRAILWR